MNSLLQDLRFAVRTLLKDTGFTTAAVLTLAVCLGANAAVFSFVNGILLRPLPVPEADRILLMSNQYPKGARRGDLSFTPDYYDRLQGTTVFEQQAMFARVSSTVGLNRLPERVSTMLVTPSFFNLVRVYPLLGRTFNEDDNQQGRELKAILSHGLWQELFGGDPGAIGRELMISGRPHTIVGVMPRGFHFVNPDIRLWVPMVFDDELLTTRHGGRGSYNIGRLAAGATIEQARTQLAAIDASNFDRFPQHRDMAVASGFYTRVEPLQELMVRDVRSTLYLFWASVAFVLLLGVANITNLTLVRVGSRRTELATRLALGAGRRRVAQQLLTESVLLAVAGGAIGLIAAQWLVDVLLRLGADRLPRINEVGVDSATVVFGLAASAGCGVLIGLVSTGIVLSVNLRQLLVERTLTGTGSPGIRVVRSALVVGQLALACVLVTGAGLLLVSFQRLLAVDTGFSGVGVVTATASINHLLNGGDDALRAFMPRALGALGELPGVSAVGATNSLPFDGASSTRLVVPERAVDRADGPAPAARFVAITAGYLEAMGIRVVRGRSFEDRDNETAPRVAIVDDRLAQRFWPNRDPIGQRLYVPLDAADAEAMAEPTHFLTVIGVAGTMRLDDLAGDRPTIGVFFYPYVQGRLRPAFMATTVKFAIKTSTHADLTVNAVRARLASVDPELSVFDFRTMGEWTDRSLRGRRSALVLAIGFGAIALCLSIIGIYGVLAYVVAQRAREFAIRIALGGTVRDIFDLVIREGALLTGIGLALGMAGNAVLTGGIEQWLYQVRPLEPAILIVIAVAMGAIALLACAVPARRATSINPAAVLNQS